MIKRKLWEQEIQTALSRSRIVVLVGPRQCGKTTLARQFVEEKSPNYFDLEDPQSLVRLDEPITTLSMLSGLIVIDEIQLQPNLFPILRVLVDQEDFTGKFLILGSASGDLLWRSAESLAGRSEIITLRGLSLGEIKQNDGSSHWLRGGFPISYLAASESNSFAWRKNYVNALLQRDLPMWGVRISPTALWRFWKMLSHYHGQTWNSAEFARALNTSEPTVRRYLDLLTDAFMVRQLKPWHANIKKRQVKSPKVYMRDSGLLHHLLDIENEQDLLTHPKLGASWEGYAIEEIIATENITEPHFWATHQGAEVDLIFVKDQKLFGIECKRTDTPKITPSIRNALEDLSLEEVKIIYPGNKRFKLSQQIEAVPLSSAVSEKLV